MATGQATPATRTGGTPASAWLPALLTALALSGCASRQPRAPVVDPDVARAYIVKHLPGNLSNRDTWAVDIFAAFEALEIAPSPQNICAVIAVTQQESTFQVNPAVPGLAGIARKEIESRAKRAGIPMMIVDTALKLKSPNGQSYRERIEPSNTELAARKLADRMALSHAAIRDDLERGRDAGFERTKTYERVFDLAAANGRTPPRAIVPRIQLKSPKITRNLTTEWFARRVDDRYRQCLRRGSDQR